MAYDSDVIVIGSGAGGGTLAYACAREGKSVLLLERGGKHSYPAGPPLSPARHEREMLIEKSVYDDRPVNVNGVAKRLYMGGILGGGTSLYGGALLRPSADDFAPGKQYGHRLPRELWDWPVSYGELEPFYSEAERLMGVGGDATDDFGPLGKPAGGYANRPLDLHPTNVRLIATNRARGLHPFRLPLAIDPDRCLRCGACAGYACPTGARRSSGHLVERAVAEGLPLRVLSGVQAERLRIGARGTVEGIEIVERATGRRAVYRARSYALAAGAIHSPLLLMRSEGKGGPHVGRNYMMHLSPVAVGVFGQPTGADESFVKQVGFSDFYFGTGTYRHKLGLVQSLPVPGPLLAAKSVPRGVPARVIDWLRRRMLPMAGIIEDLPDPRNRVTLGAAGEPRVRHRFSDYDIDRGRQLGRFMARILKTAGAALCLPTRFASDEHVAHQCGTLRFGRSPSTAVVGADCRTFAHSNLWVVDGSFFPTSLGVGPALTIIANALRVAGIIAKEI
jgi:choline dehydrogenase-like flavoprotein